MLEKRGFDPTFALYVEALDVASLCFKMTYLQLSLRGIPATVRHANTLSHEIFESAWTPAFLPFVQRHRDAFLRWQEEARAPQPAPPSTPATQGDLFDNLQPRQPSRPKQRRGKPDLTP